MLLTRHAQSDPALLTRLDPAYWHPAYASVLDNCALPLVALGEFVTDITYGPIVTGSRPPPCEDGPLVVHQGQVAATGVDLRGAIRVAAGGHWDRERARLRPEDLVLPRSGVASVARNRVSVYLEETPAVVGSFVNRIALAGLDPVFALICLKSQVVWSQIHRVVNGVGTPNISFDQIRALLIPLVAQAVQREFRQAYLARVHAGHLRWLGGVEAGGTAALHEFRALTRQLDGMALPEA